MLTFLLVLLALPVGAALGWYGGRLYYEWTAPPWGQYGYEFEGLIESFVGAGLGALLCATAVVVVRVHRARSRRQAGSAEAGSVRRRRR